MDTSFDFIERVWRCGLLLTPNLFINGFISARDPYKLATMTIENLITNCDEFYFQTWMTPLDKELLVTYLKQYSNIIGCRRKEEIERILDKVGTLPTSDALKSIAIENSQIQLADALRLEAAFAHNLTLLTWEPNHFSKNPCETDSISRVGFAAVSLGPTGFDKEEFETEAEAEAKVVVFSVDAFTRY